MLNLQETYGLKKRNMTNQPTSGPITPIVYVKEKTIWQYKRVTRNLSKEEAPGEEELNKLGKEGWELAAILTDSPIIYFYFKRLKE
jgi:hypothetical protein